MKEKLKKRRFRQLLDSPLFLIDKQGSIDYNSDVGSHNIN